MFYVHHGEPKDDGAFAEARRFPYATLDEAIAQAKHDLARPGTAPLVLGIYDKNGKRLKTPKQIASAK